MTNTQTSAYEKAYVFAPDQQGQQQLVGTLQATANSGSFQYSEQWLAAPWAYALDPQNLPLTQKRYRTLNRHGLFGVFRDAAPDDWGTRIMLLRHQHAPANELERIIRTSGSGVGGLRFSLSRSQAKQPVPLPTLASIRALAEAATKLDQQQTLKPEELALLEPGSSMGGARPKVAVSDGDETLLIKFSKSGDVADIPLLEYCSMRFLKERLGLNIPKVKLILLGEKKHAFAIKRFDGTALQPKHFISANSLFNQERIRLIEDSRRNPYSYCNLATLIRKHCNSYQQDCKELFKRMVANIVMGNTDDHARNHAIIYDIQQQVWQLSPAYDMLPILNTQSGIQAMGIGTQGATSSLENALSCANLFGLNDQQAKTIVKNTVNAYQHWPRFCAEIGVTEPMLTLIRRVTLTR